MALVIAQRTSRSLQQQSTRPCGGASNGVAHSRIEQFNFLLDFLGGPKLYAEIHGHSNVREMHMHIEIERNAHDDWLNCMSIAIDRVGLNKDVGEKLMTHVRAVAAGLQNAP